MEGNTPYLIFYYIFWLLFLAQRLVELSQSKVNEQHVIELGGKEIGQRHLLWMKIFHTLWFICCALLPLFLKDRSVYLVPFVFFTLFLIFGQTLRFFSQKELGNLWTVKVFILPKGCLKCEGIFRNIRHPSYLAVFLEVLAFPLLLGFFWVSLVFTLIHIPILMIRVREEERALNYHGEYEMIFNKIPRFVGTKKIDREKNE